MFVLSLNLHISLCWVSFQMAQIPNEPLSQCYVVCGCFCFPNSNSIKPNWVWVCSCFSRLFIISHMHKQLWISSVDVFILCGFSVVIYSIMEHSMFCGLNFMMPNCTMGKSIVWLSCLWTSSDKNSYKTYFSRRLLTFIYWRWQNNIGKYVICVFMGKIIIFDSFPS